jgi:hypothetical protein
VELVSLPRSFWSATATAAAVAGTEGRRAAALLAFDGLSAEGSRFMSEYLSAEELAQLKRAQHP